MRRVLRVAVVMALAGAFVVTACALAGAAASKDMKAPDGPKSGVLKWLADNPFAATLIFLMAATLVGTLVSRFVLDRCLRDFEGYPVTLELKDGRVYHGELDVEKSGLEFLYEKTTPQADITKTSFLIYQPEYKTVHCLVRYHDRLDEEQQEARRKAAERAYHPNFLRRWARALRNLFASIKDALIKALGLVMGKMKGIQAAAPVIKTGGTYIESVGKQTIGVAADVSYDPLLEKQIGLRVVLVLPQDSAVQDECVGTFREYTKDFFLLMDVDYECQWDIALSGPGAASFVRGIAAQRTPEGVRLRNCATYDVTLRAVNVQAPPTEGEEAPRTLKPPVAVPAVIPSGGQLDFAVPPEATAATTVTFYTCRRADLIVPRAGAFIRHKSEWTEPRKLVGHLRDAVGLLPGTDRVVSVLKQGASYVTTGERKNLVPFVKMHGCGNDYVYIDCRERAIAAPDELARRVSDRHFGIGSDGLILICPSETADYRMRMFNADGSEAEMCGNGIRCFAKYLFDRGLIKGNEARIETGAGVLNVQIFAEGDIATKVRVNMGTPRLERPEIPMEGPPGKAVDEELHIEVPLQGPVTLRFTAVSMGNPHAVIYVDDVTNYPVAVHGPLVEHHRLFPRRINTEFVETVSRSEVKMRVWERGAGETLACGTGASAVCVAGVLNGKTDRKVVVHLLGGDLELEWADDGCVYLTGPAQEVFSGTIELAEG